MVSEATWRTGSAGSPMDQQSIEDLLRRLVQRVEESERRYSEALDELHARLDQLSQTTGAARRGGNPEDRETFGRLHDQVSDLARRLEREASTPLDDFERIGRALAGDLDYAVSLSGSSSTDIPDFPASRSPQPESAPFGFSLPQNDFSFPASAPSPREDRALDNRLVEMAHRLEKSIGMAMPPQALEALNARLDEIGQQIAEALKQAPKGIFLEPVERQISDMAHQLGRAEAQLAKIGEIEAALHGLIERVDAGPSRLDEVAAKAASEAARLVAGEAKLGAATAERLDAMHRDLVAINERSRARDDRLAATLESVHESLKQLVQQVERGATQSSPNPRVPFAERTRDIAPAAAAQQSARSGERVKGDDGEAARAVPKNRLAAAIAELEDAEFAPTFGRAKRGQSEEQPFDLDTPTPRRAPAKREDASFDTSDDLVAAARRAAKAAALKAEERGGSGTRLRRASAASEAAAGELPSRRKRSVLVIFAALLLIISALLLYGRLRSKPEGEVAPPAAEQSAPAPSSSPSDGEPGAAPDESAPSGAEPAPATPATPGSSEAQPGWEIIPSDKAASEQDGSRNFTDVAKSPYRPDSSDGPIVPAQPASLQVSEAPALPPGVVLSVEGAGLGDQAPAMPLPSNLPTNLALPPYDLGPLALRQAAAQGDARAQYAVALRYAQGLGTPENLTEAVVWLERAASAGLAPAQYRLGAMYERGQGVARDLGRARSWYQAAAEKGNVKAMHNLAVSASGRDGGGADYALAAKWYEQAASYGLADSQYNLGILAEHGLGIPKDLPAAYKWFSLAAKSSDQEAAKWREQIKLQLDAASLAEAERNVAAWTPKRAAPEANDVVEPQEWADLSSASSTALVSRAQSLLNKLGYNVGEPDGLMGTRTREAIKSFERKNGLEETGQVTIPLVTKLERMTS